MSATLFLGFGFVLVTLAQQQEPGCNKRFEYEFGVLQKLVQLEESAKKQAEDIRVLQTKLNEADQKTKELSQTISTLDRTADGTTYVRWGRKDCPEGATLVYQGIAGGAHYTHSGSAANTLCLHQEPTWNEYVEGFQTADRIYGAEYQTGEYPARKHLLGHDVPCAVCRIPRSNVYMLPGRNVCDGNYRLEYSGYLMTEHYTHASNTEYVCMDDQPESVAGGHEGKGGRYFYHVEASCGSLRCPPYFTGRELTCAVCSYYSNLVLTNISLPIAN